MAKKEMSMVSYGIDHRIAYITINRPEKKNAFNQTLVKELTQVFAKAEKDEEVKVVVLRANGDVFSAGADLDYLQDLQKNTYEENLADSDSLKKLFETIYSFSKVTIAQVEGHAIAGGCGLTTVCDFVFAVPEADFGYTEVKIGFVPALVTYFLIRKIGEGKARELLLTGELINANNARYAGLVNYVVKPAEIEEKVHQYARNIADRCSGNSIKLTKELITNLPQLSLDKALKLASEANAKARSSDDCKKGIAAFLGKERIKW